MAFLYCLSKRKNRPAATKPDDPSSPSSFPLPFLSFLRLARTHALLALSFSCSSSVAAAAHRGRESVGIFFFVDPGSSKPLYSLVFFALLHLLLYFCLLLTRVSTPALCGAVHCPVVLLLLLVSALFFSLDTFFLKKIFCFSSFWSLF